MRGGRLRASGELSCAALLVSALSGLALAYQYDPEAPFTSTVAMEAALFSGSFLRALHWWSSQAFFLLLLWHTAESLDSLPSLRARPGGRTYWAVLSSTVFMGLWCLFTGYILRWDQTGRDAAAIAERLLTLVPLVGGGFNRLLLARESEGLLRAYAVHVAFTALLWGLGTWYHTRRPRLREPVFWTLLGPLLLVSALFPAPLTLPGKEADLVKGPWFFLGVQEALRHVPPLLGGVLLPALPLLLLSSLGALEARARRTALLLLGAWCLFYSGLTAVSWLR